MKKITWIHVALSIAILLLFPGCSETTGTVQSRTASESAISDPAWSLNETSSSFVGLLPSRFGATDGAGSCFCDWQLSEDGSWKMRIEWTTSEIADSAYWNAVGYSGTLEEIRPQSASIYRSVLRNVSVSVPAGTQTRESSQCLYADPDVRIFTWQNHGPEAFYGDPADGQEIVFVFPGTDLSDTDEQIQELYSQRITDARIQDDLALYIPDIGMVLRADADETLTAQAAALFGDEWPESSSQNLKKTLPALQGVREEGARYSGPACLQVLLQNEGISRTQSQLASELKTTAESGSDLRTMVSVLNQYMQEAGSPVYSCILLDQNEVTENTVSSLKASCIGAVDSGKYPVITIDRMTLYETPANSARAYVIVTGYELDASGELLSLDLLDGEQNTSSVTYAFSEILPAMRACPWFAYAA